MSREQYRRVTVTEFRSCKADVVSEVGYGKERVILTRNGRDVVALVPMSDFEVIEAVRAKQAENTR